MTHIVESQAKSSLHNLREALEQAERQIVHLDGLNIEAFLVRLDQIEQMFADFGQSQDAARSEEGRWKGLLNRIASKPELLVNAASRAGGLSKLRSKHPPATGSWWHWDSELARRRTQSWKRAAMILGAVVVVVALVIVGVNYFTSANNAGGSLASATTDIEQLVASQQWPAALAALEKARRTLPDAPELLVWEGVLAEQTGDAARAKTSLAQAQQKLAKQPAAFWLLVGNDRQMAGNLDGAEAAAQQALASAPQDAQVSFLLGSVAEARGETAQAADYFSKTIALAGDTNPALATTARVRMGYLTQKAEPLPGTAPVPTMTPTPAPQSP
jgi:tetratricopeptide (TPR) repeat protein